MLSKENLKELLIAYHWRRRHLTDRSCATGHCVSSQTFLSSPLFTSDDGWLMDFSEYLFLFYFFFIFAPVCVWSWEAEGNCRHDSESLQVKKVFWDGSCSLLRVCWRVGHRVENGAVTVIYRDIDPWAHKRRKKRSYRNKKGNWKKKKKKLEKGSWISSYAEARAVQHTKQQHRRFARCTYTTTEKEKRLRGITDADFFQ